MALRDRGALDSCQPQIGTRSHTRAGFTSYEEANDALTVLRAELIRSVPQVIGRDTFGAYGQLWLDGHRLRPLADFAAGA